MTDEDLDTLLTRHGEAWRAANNHRPGVDWDAATPHRRSRSWAALGAAAAAVATAVVVPLVLTSGGAMHRAAQSPVPGTRPLPSPSVARQGAPAGFFALANGEGNYVTFSGTVYGGHGPHRHPVALGADSSGSQAYTASPLPGCRTSIDQIRNRPHYDHGEGLVDTTHVTTIAGRVAPKPMAVSSDGTNLAFVLDRGIDSNGRCVGYSGRLGLLDLATKRVSTGLADRFTYFGLGALQWSPDGRRLAFAASVRPGNCTRCPAEFGEYVMRAGSGRAFAAGHVRLLVSDPMPRTPIFWWHGRLVTLVGSDMRALLPNGTPSEVVARNFPKRVATVSSDATGNHLLLGGGGSTYRWDNGVLTKLKQPLLAPYVWTQPGW